MKSLFHNPVPFFILNSIFLFSCGEHYHNDFPETPEDSIRNHPMYIEESVDSLPSPSDFFIEMVNDLVRSGISCDTARYLHQVSGSGYAKYQRHELIENIGSNTFFALNFPENHLYHYINDTLKISLNKYQKIIGYYFSRKIDSKNTADGMIEEWKLETREEAKKMADYFSDLPQHVIFPNIGYYCISRGKYFYIVYSRASAYMTLVKEVYESFNDKIKKVK